MQRRILIRRTLAVGATFASVPLGRLFAQGPGYPNRPVRLVCGFATGGSGDTLARSLQPEVSRLMGQALVVENRPGAGSNIASEHVARSAPDGYTTLLGGSFSHSVNPVLFASLPYDAQKDFTAVYYIGGAPSVFVVPASLPVQSMQDFIDHARREGNRVNYASAGFGSPGHIAGSYFNRILELQMQHVAYKGSGEAVRDLLAGEIQMTVTSVVAVLPMIRQGRLKPLALTSPRKARSAPDIPTSAEAGLKDFDLDGWYGVFAPASTAPEIIATLHAAFKGAIENPTVSERLASQGLEPVDPISPAAFAAFLKEDAARWRSIVETSGAKVQ